METNMLFIKLIVLSAFTTLAVEPFAIMCYCTITFGVVYTVIIPKYKRNKIHKQWVKEGMKKEDRYKWEDVQ